MTRRPRLSRFRAVGRFGCLVGRRLSALALIVCAAGSAPAQTGVPGSDLLDELWGWRDSVTISGRRYEVPELWRGLRLGLEDQPPPTDLVSVPPELRLEGREPLLRARALAAFREMALVAAQDSIELRIRSGYRPPMEQTLLIERRMAAGREFDEIIQGVAPPGYSEHMLGTTVDLELGRDYMNNPAYHWLKEHGPAFGWHESYPRNSQAGFPWEPWHWRYRGKPRLGAERVLSDEAGK
jgi:hypothetical protein